MHLKISSHRDSSHHLLVGGYDKGLKDAIYSISYDLSEASMRKGGLNVYLHESLGYEVELSRTCYPYKSLGYGVELLDSCNGLVFLVYFDSDNNHGGSGCREDLFFCLWNPATGEYKKIVKPTSNFAYVKFSMCAFGYDHKSDDYKLVIGVDNGQVSSSVHIYTLGSDSWKSTVTVNYSFDSDRKSGLFVNGGFHWLADEEQGKLIVSLDINEERFGEIELPTELEANERCSYITEGLLDGRLCVLVADDGYYNPRAVGVWVMQDYGVRETWDKCYDITHEKLTDELSDRYSPCLKFICSLKDGEILFMTLDKLVLYDPKNRSAGERYTGSVKGFRSKVNYFESLVSVHSGTCMRKRKREESNETQEAYEEKHENVLLEWLAL
ncbi:F-box/kelch-repeat protein At3g06240-like [Papaver somniferum]|uniref:F-box/kelch-repeat protein At3g06240-like n=1 Tax=Papaver somniferum TaxID=3469 RepID=UPI000E6FB8DE|nr:F-box/kelch-repeat protein At3g06240-like [Papaver somniferum]